MTDRRERGVWRRRRADSNAPAPVAPAVAGLPDDIAHQLYGDAAPLLRALLTISHAVMKADFFDEALEVIAEQSLRALDAASLSISRWERDADVLRTLINVGRLGPGEERWPEDETYPVLPGAHIARLLQHGQPYINSVHDPHADDEELAVLRWLEKDSELAVPVMYDDVMWGELWASGDGGRRFGPDDVQLLQAIAAHVAVAIGRSELFSTVWRYSYEDPLTQLANRRGLDAHIDDLGGTPGDSAVVAVCDLDGFKSVNDRHGHPVGDELLRVVAAALRSAADPFPGSMVARLGGDEFCVVLPQAGRDDAGRLIDQVTEAVRRHAVPPVSLTWGVAATDVFARTSAELIATADAAMITAKRARDSRRRLDRASAAADRTAPADLVSRVVAALDRHQPTSALDALTCLAEEIVAVADISAWSVIEATDGAGELRVRRAAAPYGPSAGADAAVTVAASRGPVTFRLELHERGGAGALTALLPHLRVLAHYCTQFGSGDR